MDEKKEIEKRNVQLMDLAKKIHSYQRKYEKEHDGRAVFAYIYCKMTKKTAEYLAECYPTPHDPDWIVTLAEAFAARYFAAMNALDRWQEGRANGNPASILKEWKQNIPQPWLAVYKATRPGQSSVLEDLVFAMMAHITYDLPYALKAINFSKEYIADYQTMNDILGQQIGSFEQDVTRRYSRFLTFLDRITGNYGYFFTDLGIRTTRSLAWYNACLLNNPSAQEAASVSLEQSTGQFINYIRNPKEWYLGVLISVLRWLTPVRSQWRRKWPEDE